MAPQIVVKDTWRLIASAFMSKMQPVPKLWSIECVYWRSTQFEMQQLFRSYTPSFDKNIKAF